MTEYRVYYTSKYDMFVITKDDGTLTGKYETDLYCKSEIMANKVCDLLNENKQLKKINKKLYEEKCDLDLKNNRLKSEIKDLKDVLARYEERYVM